MSASPDPYRAWLRARLGGELGVQEAELAIQGAVQRRGWPGLRVLGPRDVVAVLQDVYGRMRETLGDARADRWLEATSHDLAEFAAQVPTPAAPPSGPIAPAPGPLRWGRRAHDLPLLLARARAEIAGRTLEAIRANPDLRPLERAAEWDVQAAAAEVRRREQGERLTRLREAHARAEVADQVAAARAQLEVLRLTAAELEEAAGHGELPRGAPALAQARLSLSQTAAFLDAFAPLVHEPDADAPLAVPEVELQGSAFALGVPLHPDVLRARHALDHALWQAGDAETPAAGDARRALAGAEAEARAQLDSTLGTARVHQDALRGLCRRLTELEARALALARPGGDELSLARVRLEWRQTRAAARVEAHRLREALTLLETLVGEDLGDPG